MWLHAFGGLGVRLPDDKYTTVTHRSALETFLKSSHVSQSVFSQFFSSCSRDRHSLTHSSLALADTPWAA